MIFAKIFPNISMHSLKSDFLYFCIVDLKILYEDNHLIAVNKPFGVLSQGDEKGTRSIFDDVVEYLRIKYQKSGNVYLALLHRIDRPVGGLIIFAKTSKAAARMSELFRERSIQKTYYAITEAAPTELKGRLTHWLTKQSDKNIVKASNKPSKNAQEAILDYEVIKVINNRALIQVKPLTGRPHQIRVQLAKIGCPIVGDVKYGKTNFMPDQSILLFSKKLEFIHPVKKEPIIIEAPFPKGQIWDLFQ